VGYSEKFELGGMIMEKDFSSFMQKGEDGAISSFDETKFNSFIDSEISKAVESFKTKFEKEQARASMNEQEKLQEQLKEFEQAKAEFEASMKAQKTELVKTKAETKLKSANFTDKEIELLTKYVTEDEKASLAVIDEMIAERTKYMDDSKKKIIEELQGKQPKGQSQSNAEDKNANEQPVKRTSQDIKNLYK
jgi:hypothetical protein